MGGLTSRFGMELGVTLPLGSRLTTKKGKNERVKSKIALFVLSSLSLKSFEYLIDVLLDNIT